MRQFACLSTTTSSAIWHSVATVVLLAVAGCGGGGDLPGPTESPTQASAAQRVITADVRGCGPAQVNDNGSVLYIVVARICITTEPLEVSLTTTSGNHTVSQWVSVAAYGASMPVELTPGEVREMSVHRRGTWHSVANVSAWDWRDGAGLLSKDGGLYLLGGWNSETGPKNDVWFTRNIQDWSQLTSQAPWAARHGAGWLVHDNRLFVIGGDLIDDVWSSADGISWTPHVAAAAFGKRYTPNAISDGQRMFLYGGQYWAPYDWCAFKPECEAVGLNDVWASIDGGEWARQATAPWEGRGLVHGGAYFKGRIYVIGGGLKLALPGAELSETVKEFSDIWSSANGIDWRREAESLGFAPRTHFALLATASGCWVANGSVGLQSNYSSEVHFAPDCVHFSPIPDPSPMAVRHASSLVEFNGSIVVLGGHRDNAGTTIWQYFPDVTSN